VNARTRTRISVVLIVISGLLLPVGLLSLWANSTIYDSTTFSERSVDLLNSPSVRKEVADRITEQLARGGNQQAVNFRPAFQLAVEAAIDTDTFRSIFRTAIKRTHEAILVDQSQGTSGLDLSDSFAIIASTLQLPDSAAPGQTGGSSLGATFADTTERLGSWGVWQLDDISGGIALLALGGSLAFAIAAIAIAADRRKAVKRLGWAIVAVGAFIMLVLQIGQFVVGQFIGDAELRPAVEAALARATADLFMIGLWTAGYGVIVAAAASAMAAHARRVTPTSAAQSIAAWADRRRRSTGGTLVLAAVAFVAGLALISSPTFWVRAAVILVGLWLVYFAVTEGLRLIRTVTVEHQTTRSTPARVGRGAVIGGALVALMAVLTFVGIRVTQQSARDAEAAGVTLCNGEESLCDLPLNAAVLPASHNSMSSSLYPGWLFAEQISTIRGQLDAGVRALLIDTHYGVKSASRLPGSETPIVLTDRAAELAQPPGEDIDPAIAERANQLASRAPISAGAERDIYLCHNFCELGAITFSSALAEVKGFVDTHPDDVVMLVIQDATTPADTADAIIAAGLEDKIWTLERGKPIPTIREMIEAGRTVLVFAEQGGSGAPDWYQKAYDHWFQETGFRFRSVDQFDCAPNRGPSNAPFFLINHWISSSPPDPAKASQANTRDVIEERIRQCLDDRGQYPNAIAADFAERGALVATVRDLNANLREEIRSLQAQARPGGNGSPETTTPGASTSTSPPSGGGSLIAPPTVLTTLTGGNPSAFCAAAPELTSVVASWALSSFTTIPAAQGQPDLAYAPAAARALATARAVAPDEIVARTDLAAARADAAVAVLRELGLNDQQLDELADLTVAKVTSTDTDALVDQEALIARVAEMVGDRSRVDAAADAFAIANPEPEALFDFGDVTEDVARSSGYACLIITS
jgi:hypothetical protein